MAHSSSGRRPQPGTLRIAAFAVACGAAVANVYFPQALTPLIASGLRITSGDAALAVTWTQLGYAAGIFFLVPLGDRLPHRPLVLALLATSALGLLAAGTATSVPLLASASAVVGAATVVPQILIPMAAGLVAPARRGAVVGTLLAGLLTGILLARAAGGILGAWLGWRAPYLAAAGLTLAMAGLMAATLPRAAPPSRERYRALLATAATLFREERELRRSCLYQVCLFAAFTAAWTSLALLVTGPSYGLGPRAIAALSLVGAGSALTTPFAGRLLDRRGPDPVNVICFAGALASAAVLWLGSLGGAGGLAALGAGMLLLDVSVQCGQVANQARIFALRPEARARLNTAYMTCAFLGGSAGSWLGVRLHERSGWAGVCALVAAAAALPMAVHVWWRPSPRAAGA